MTYTVSSGTLNPTQLNPFYGSRCILVQKCWLVNVRRCTSYPIVNVYNRETLNSMILTVCQISGTTCNKL